MHLILRCISSIIKSIWRQSCGIKVRYLNFMRIDSCFDPTMGGRDTVEEWKLQFESIAEVHIVPYNPSSSHLDSDTGTTA